MPLTNLLRLPEGASKETMSIYLFIFCSHLDVLYVIFLYVMYVYPFFRINVIIIIIFYMYAYFCRYVKHSIKYIRPLPSFDSSWREDSELARQLQVTPSEKLGDWLVSQIIQILRRSSGRKYFLSQGRIPFRWGGKIKIENSYEEEEALISKFQQQLLPHLHLETVSSKRHFKYVYHDLI